MAYELGLYAKKDALDQEIFKLGVRAGYDLIILTHMEGSYQIVTEILDTRKRDISFDNLVYIVD